MQLRGDSIRISLACNWKLDLLNLIENDVNVRENVYDFVFLRINFFLMKIYCVKDVS